MLRSLRAYMAWRVRVIIGAAPLSVVAAIGALAQCRFLRTSAERVSLRSTKHSPMYAGKAAASSERRLALQPTCIPRVSTP